MPPEVMSRNGAVLTLTLWIAVRRGRRDAQDSTRLRHQVASAPSAEESWTRLNVREPYQFRSHEKHPSLQCFILVSRLIESKLLC